MSIRAKRNGVLVVFFFFFLEGEGVRCKDVSTVNQLSNLFSERSVK